LDGRARKKKNLVLSLPPAPKSRAPMERAPME
jgi:hypothetical protein